MDAETGTYCPNCGNVYEREKDYNNPRRKPIFPNRSRRVAPDTTERIFECWACHYEFSVTDNPDWSYPKIETLSKVYK